MRKVNVIEKEVLTVENLKHLKRWGKLNRIFNEPSYNTGIDKTIEFVDNYNELCDSLTAPEGAVVATCGYDRRKIFAGQTTDVVWCTHCAVTKEFYGFVIVECDDESELESFIEARKEGYKV